MVQTPSTHVDYRVSIAYVGTVLKYIGVTPLFPLVLSVYYAEDPLPFVVASIVMVGGGFVLEQFGRDGNLGNREAFLLVSLAWLLVPVAGTVPYLIAGTGTVAHPVNALFESMSGFTTTGSTVLGEISVERHGHAMLMWRQLTQWLGGMGILVLMIAILPKLSVGGAQVINQEAPGISLEKLTPRIQQTARALWGIYVAFTTFGIGFGIFGCWDIVALRCLRAEKSLKQLVRCLRVGWISVFLNVFKSWYVGVVASVMTVCHADPPEIASKFGRVLNWLTKQLLNSERRGSYSPK